MGRRCAARWVIGAVATIATMVATPTPAWAHAELLSSDPAYGDRLAVAPAEFRLKFSEAIKTTGARLRLHRNGAQSERLRGLASPTS